MYLKKIELQGFKSFPDKIRLDFNKGITAVVGPNGSGKSNISDAVRWVLGEKSAKNLRGSKMEDIIFNGTKNRKPVNFAEVSLIIDNEDKKLNIDFSEITVTRRVFRSGESEYYINGAKCRAKDVLELFMDTGVGKEGYSIIGQGRIDEILSSRSEDRRLIFEEASGIVKYRNRSIEASNKLEKERENLVRVNDIIDELEKQIEPLSEQAEKAKKCLILIERLKLVQVNIFVRDVDKFESEIKEVSKNINQLKIDIGNEMRFERINNEKRESLKESLLKIENFIENNSNEIANKRLEKEQRENDIKLCNQVIKYLLEDIERIKEESKDSNSGISEKRKSILKNEKEIEKLGNLFNEKNKFYKEQIEKFSKFNLKVSQNEDEINAISSSIIEKINLSSKHKNEIGKYEAILSQYKERKEKIDLNIEDLNRKLLERKNVLKEDEKALNEFTKDISNYTQLVNSSVDKINLINKEIVRENEKFSLISRDIGDKSARIKILTDLEKAYEGYYTGVKAILNQRDLKNAKFNGIYGAIGELISCEKKYETAIEIALGQAIQNIVAKSEDDVKVAIEFLKKSNKGRATFYPMTAVKGRAFGGEKDFVLAQKGVIGIAKNIIKYDSIYENIMSSLLERVIVVDNMENGISLAKLTNYKYKIVTLEGDVLNSGGSMTGGSISKKTAGVFSRSRELKELKINVEKNLKEKSVLENKLSSLERQKVELTEQIEKSKNILQELEIKKSHFSSRILQIKEYCVELEDRIDKLKKEVEDISKNQIEIEKNVVKVKLTLDGIEKEIEDKNRILSDFQEKIQSDRTIRENSNEEISKLRIEISKIENEIANFESENKRLNLEIEKLELVIENSEVDISKTKVKIEEENKKKVKFEEDVLNIDNSHSSLIKKGEDFVLEKAKIIKEIDQLEVDIKKQGQTKASLEKELIRLEGRKEQLDNRCRALYDSMWEEYEMTYVSAKKEKVLNVTEEDLKVEARKLKSEIKLLGNVNFNAVDEYSEVKQRYDFLKTNRDDIIKTERELINIINDLEKMMEKQFKEQFSIISKNFSQTFNEMFGGGSAELKLSDDKDILNSGIDIIVQPPGKSLQNMMLLSGGEKALTAMALLFAILKMKPSPFCILDEIEAALDDANVSRYANYLSNFVEDTQFIVITHRKGTMEVADILYGVTMQEKGVSSLVSLKFDEKGVNL